MTAGSTPHVYDAALGAESDLQSFFEADSLVIATRFFRHPELVNDFEKIIMPSLLKQKRVLAEKRVQTWCAGCSDGREAYSFAISTDRSLKAHNGTSFRGEVRGSDISRPQIAKAKAGLYSITSHDREAIEPYIEYFLDAGANIKRIDPKIQGRVTFAVEDIIKSIEKESVDVLICSLVVLYYEAQYQIEIVDQLISAVRPGGYFYVAPVSKRRLGLAGHIPVGGESGSFFQKAI